ncbi:DOMON domain-containing protein [Fusarium sp. LHS14.1]|nr:DOMON domain-containing protein [Fusarium sp. LHS14.1]
MKSTVGTLLASTAALYARGTSAVTSSFCPNSGDVCFRWGVPEASASSGSGNIYFQMEAPSSVQWAGLGIGSSMSGAEMFLIYQNGDGNVTLSTRTGTGHVMPQYTRRTAVELLAGSGVSGGKLIANIRCGDCDSLDFEGSNSWIAAWKNGDSLDSTSVSERISEHDEHSSFSVNFAQASMSSDSNPFTSSSTDSGSDSGSDSDSDSNSGSGSGSDSGSDSNSGVTESSGPSKTVLRAHGIIMSIVFLAGYPLGAVLMPIIGNWLVHAGWQFIVFLGMWAGFGLGYVYARDDGYWWKQTHTKMGTIVVALMGLQPLLGFAHHRYFRSHGKRGIISHVHIWLGRILMILGIINGGLGLQLASSSKGYIIAYSVIAGIAALLYTGSIFVGGMRRTARTKSISPQMSQEEQR